MTACLVWPSKAGRKLGSIDFSTGEWGTGEWGGMGDGLICCDFPILNANKSQINHADQTGACLLCFLFLPVFPYPFLVFPRIFRVAGYGYRPVPGSPHRMKAVCRPFAIAPTAAARSVRQNLRARWKSKPIGPYCAKAGTQETARRPPMGRCYFLLIPSEFCHEGVAQPAALDRA